MSYGPMRCKPGCCNAPTRRGPPPRGGSYTRAAPTDPCCPPLRASTSRRGTVFGLKRRARPTALAVPRATVRASPARHPTVCACAAGCACRDWRSRTARVRCSPGESCVHPSCPAGSADDAQVTLMPKPGGKVAPSVDGKLCSEVGRTRKVVCCALCSRQHAEASAGLRPNPGGFGRGQSCQHSRCHGPGGWRLTRGAGHCTRRCI
jgi:hypothetical protein